MRGEKQAELVEQTCWASRMKRLGEVRSARGECQPGFDSNKGVHLTEAGIICLWRSWSIFFVSREGILPASWPMVSKSHLPSSRLGMFTRCSLESEHGLPDKGDEVFRVSKTPLPGASKLAEGVIPR